MHKKKYHNQPSLAFAFEPARQKAVLKRIKEAIKLPAIAAGEMAPKAATGIRQGG